MDIFNKAVVGSMPVIPKPIVGKIASRYVAGEKLHDAVRVVKELMDEGAMATMDLLGEYSKTESDANRTAETYKAILDTIHEEKLDSNISVKPTALGLKLGYEFCEELITGIVDHAKSLKNFVRIDMEDHTCTDHTLKMFFNIHKKYPKNVGVVIQAYLRRTRDDARWLGKMKANLRLCKGIYNEPRMIAFKNRQIIINNYAHVLELLLKSSAYVGIATHCEETIWQAEKILYDMNLPKDKYEFQMLLGVDPELRKILLNNGHRLRVYVPYGEEWYPYSSRRLKENPELAGSIAREFLGVSKPGR